MSIVKIQFTPWDKVYYFDSNNLDLSKGDKVVVKTEMGVEIGEVVGLKDGSGKEGGCGCPKKEGCGKCKSESREIKPVLRVVNSADMEKVAKKEEIAEAMKFCKTLIKKYKLSMKLVDVHFAYDGSRATFAFIAESRIDFRELVKDLTRHFNRSIRMQQIGIRDEAKMVGDYGHCGKPLCCRGFLNDLVPITSEMAEVQQCAHRGSDRISGICGRLMCCLSYENLGYEELAKKMPPIGTKVNVDGKKGVIIGHHTLKQSVNVKFNPEKKDERPIIAEVDLNRDKK
ncbi:MAG: hypothetical protein GWO79_00245 [Actinobacteria bacterium]|nr:hypothetical protein [Actinomycetota bacterium]